MNRLKVAIQKSGRLHEKSIKLIKDCGININLGKKLKTQALNFPMDIFFLRDDDIPQYIQSGIADIGIVGKNVVFEQNKNILIKQNLGFGRCRLSLAVPNGTIYNNVKDLSGKCIATSHPNLLKKCLKQYKIYYYIHTLSGSVEITPNIERADAIFDIVSSGETLFLNNLKEFLPLFYSEAVLVCCPKYEQKTLVKLFIFRLQTISNKE